MLRTPRVARGCSARGVFMQCSGELIMQHSRRCAMLGVVLLGVSLCSAPDVSLQCLYAMLRCLAGSFHSISVVFPFNKPGVQSISPVVSIL